MGHTGMGCLDREHFEFEQFVRGKFDLASTDIVPSEFCFCGIGLPFLYEFYLRREGGWVDSNLGLSSQEVLSSIETNPTARKSYERFLQLLGTSLMTASGAFLPDEGIIIYGHMVREVLPALLKDVADPQNSIFLRAFENNSCLNNYLKTIPIFFSGENELSLKGCYNYLLNK